MERHEAIEVLARHGFTPGASSTRGLDPVARAEVKAACAVISKGDPAPDVPPPSPPKPRKTPRRNSAPKS